MGESTFSDLPNKRLVTPKEAADFLRCSPRQVYYLVEFSKIDGIKLGHSSLRITRDSLIRLLEESTS
jgi:excisionase family DNA binding protein